MDGHDVTLLAGRISVGDTTIVSLEGHRIRPLAAGNTGLTMSFGNRGASRTYTCTIARGHSRNSSRPTPGHSGGRDRRRDARWRLPASQENYFVMILPDSDGHQVPSLAIVGANCIRALDRHSFFCLALHDASVIAYHSQRAEAGQKLSGMLAVWREAWR